MSDYRSHIRTEWPPERIAEALDELAATETTRSHDVKCKHCGRTGNYKIPQADGKVRLEAIRFAAEHGYGKAAQAKDTDARPLELTKPVADMGKAERDAFKQELLARLGSTSTDQPKYDLSVD